MDSRSTLSAYRFSGLYAGISAKYVCRNKSNNQKLRAMKKKKNIITNTIATGALALLATPDFAQPMITSERQNSDAVVPCHMVLLRN